MYKNQKLREWWKHVLVITRVKLIFERIALTRYTTLYFFLALLSCIILVVLQSTTYLSNTEGAQVVHDFLRASNVTSALGVSFLSDGHVMLCDDIPMQPGTQCDILVHRVHDHIHVRRHYDFGSESLGIGGIDETQQCAVSLMWLSSVLQDARTEDIVTLAFQIWLLALSVVTLLNESLPHLIAGLAARTLAIAWGSFRVRGNINLVAVYFSVIDSGPCQGRNIMGDWWKQNNLHDIAGLVTNSVNAVLMAGLSYKLYHVYSSQTFSRVGAAPEIHRVYMLVLLFSVVLQLAGFFTLAQAGLWVWKITRGSIQQLADNLHLYVAGLVVTTVLIVPWLVMGWMSVRKESRTLFGVFCLISAILLSEATAMFASRLNQFVLGAWSFYATLSIAAYILLVITLVLAIACRLQFGLGLAHFLHVTKALDADDFTPVYFSKQAEVKEWDDIEKKAEDAQTEFPVLSYKYSYGETGNTRSSLEDPASPDLLKQPVPARTRRLDTLSTILLADNGTPGKTIKLSSTPAVARQGGNPSLTSSVILQPVMTRSSSKNTDTFPPQRGKGRRPPDIVVPPAPELDAVAAPPSSSPKSRRTRSESGEEHRRREPTKILPAHTRSASLHRGPVTVHLKKPSGDNFF
ncbi:unnamed protein product [Mycena citricolor]|uniref:Uncharacterized protein n=1 Tax=Mycena citricolor TaxID=2018698 RepID=A0AAD2HIP8_9AGAR|nr:unnamed protein product [Mycena citricolor]